MRTGGWSDTLSDVVHRELLCLEKRRQPPRLNDLNIEVLKGDPLGAELPPRRVEEAVETLKEGRNFYLLAPYGCPDDSDIPKDWE